MPSDLPYALRELAEMQSGVVSRQQACEAGVSSDAIVWRLRRGRWQQVQRGVYAVFSGQPDRHAVLWSALLRAGPGAVLSHHTAAELARLTDAPSGLTHVTVPTARRVRPVPGLVVHRSPGRASPGTPACCRPGPGLRKPCLIWSSWPARPVTRATG